AVIARDIERTAAGMPERVADDPSKLISDAVELSEADRAVMASPERHEAIRKGINEAFRQGVWGYVDDIFCLIQPWGFEVTEIRVPTRILYGLTDVLVPRQHGEWLAHNVPNPQAVIHEQGGHFSAPHPPTQKFPWPPPPAPPRRSDPLSAAPPRRPGRGPGVRRGPHDDHPSAPGSRPSRELVGS